MSFLPTYKVKSVFDITPQKLKKDNTISEDDEKRYETEIQKLTDEATKKVDEMLAQKEKDILQV